MNMREIVVKKIKQVIDWQNECDSWKEDYVSKKYPDFEKESDESLFEIYDNMFRGPCG